jgi:hypothetical protein
MTDKKKTTKKAGKIPKKGTTASKKKSLDKIEQIHGKEENFEPTSLDQIWGDTGLNKYSTFDKDEYRTYLDDLNKTDLQQHAIKIGLVPIRERNRLTANLITAFQQHVAQYQKPSQGPPPDSPGIDPEIEKILSEGR